MHIKLGTCVPNLRGRWWVEHTQMHPARGRVQKISITLAKLVEFLVISIFHETKIRMVDMKVQVYSKFWKTKLWKKVKSPNSMRNGRFDTSKWRGKLEKMGVLCTYSPKSLGPFPKLPIKNWPKCRRKLQKNYKIIKKKTMPTLSRRRPPAGGRPGVARRPWVGLPFLIFNFFVLPSTFCTSGQLLLVGSSTCPPCPKFT
jgi:hypothetical protein